MRFATEKESIDYVCEWLRNHGYTNIDATQSTNQFCHYDIMCVNPSGLTYEIELKRRNFNSDLYETSIMETNKYFNMLNDRYEGKIHGGFLINLYEDCFTVANVLTPLFYGERTVKHYTELAYNDNEKILKGYVNYKPIRTYQYK